MSTTVRNETRQRILELIKSKGPHDATALADRLGISPMGVRQHLYILAAKGLVEYEERSGGVGRPAKLWQLTEAAERQFPDSHPELSIELLEAVRETLGPDGVTRLLGERTRKQLANYLERIPPAPDLDVRLDALARIRRDEGYMAESRRQHDGSFVLIENHCSIGEAARACTGLCDSELELFRAVLRTEAIEREEHIVNGDRRCLYRVMSTAAKDDARE